MGFIALHSTHESKPFMRLMGTTCSVKWRKSGVKERLWNINPSHPIMKGIDNYFELEHVEMYGERFDIPKPDDILMISWYPSGEVFRSVCTWTRGNGRIVHIMNAIIGMTSLIRHDAGNKDKVTENAQCDKLCVNRNEPEKSW